MAKTIAEQLEENNERRRRWKNNPAHWAYRGHGGTPQPEVGIGGVLEVGQTLQGYGVNLVPSTHQWLRCDPGGGNCAFITGATNATYQIVAGDAGMTLRLLLDGTYVSSPTAVVPTPESPPVPETALTTEAGDVLTTEDGVILTKEG